MTRQILRKTKLRFNLNLHLKRGIQAHKLSSLLFDANQSLGDLKKDLEKLECVKYVTYNNGSILNSLDAVSANSGI